MAVDKSDEHFVCYHCKEGDCPSCVGVPCKCECPYGRIEGEQRCTFKGCENRGQPQKGFDFFICDSCFVEFERLLNEKYAQRQERHAKN